jgi:hypothetical protein
VTTYSSITYDFTFPVHILRFHWDFSTKSYTIAFDLLLLWTLLPSNFKDENVLSFFNQFLRIILSPHYWEFSPIGTVADIRPKKKNTVGKSLQAF